MEFLILGGVVFVSSVLGGTYYSCVYKPISTDEVALPAGSSTTTNNITLGDDGLSDENASALLLPPKTKKKMDECQLVNNEKLELLKKKGAGSSRNGTFGSIFGKSNRCIEEEDEDDGIEGKGYIEIPEYATSSILTRLSLQQTSHTTSLKTFTSSPINSQHTIQQEEQQQQQEEGEETTEVVDIEKFLRKEREKNFEQVLMEKHPYHIAESFGNDARKNYSPPVAFIQNSIRSTSSSNNSTSTIH